MKTLTRAIALATFASVLSTSSALADHNWRGFYVGAVLGYEHQDGDAVLPTAPVNFGTVSFNGAQFGGVVGFNFMPGGILLGVEADIVSHFGQHETTTLGGLFGDYSSDYTATIRARGGVVVEDTLLFLTAGYGMTQITVEPSPIFGPGQGFADDTVGGWVIGAGFETFISDHFSVAVQYLHAEYGDTDPLVAAPFAIPTVVKDPSSDVVNISLRWHWGD